MGGPAQHPDMTTEEFNEQAMAEAEAAGAPRGNQLTKEEFNDERTGNPNPRQISHQQLLSRLHERGTFHRLQPSRIMPTSMRRSPHPQGDPDPTSA